MSSEIETVKLTAIMLSSMPGEIGMMIIAMSVMMKSLGGPVASAMSGMGVTVGFVALVIGGFVLASALGGGGGKQADTRCEHATLARP